MYTKVLKYALNKNQSKNIFSNKLMLISKTNLNPLNVFLS